MIKLFLQSGLVLLMIFAVFVQNAGAIIVFQDDIFHDLPSENLLLDAFGSGSNNTSIQFGNDFDPAENGVIKWNISSNSFNFSHSIDVEGDLSLGTGDGSDIIINFDNGEGGQFGWDDSEGAFSTFGTSLLFPIEVNPTTDPPGPCDADTFGEFWMDSTTGNLYVCDISNGRNKWLSTFEDVIWGESKDEGNGKCEQWGHMGSDPDCAVKWGDGLGFGQNREIGFYIPRDITITGFSYSQRQLTCNQPNDPNQYIAVEVWGTGGNDVDSGFSIANGAEIARINGDQLANNSTMNVDVDGDQYIIWGIRNQCSQSAYDFNVTLYYKARKDYP
ncbi:hypothetical protein GF340_00475 [Candidatus Peregrinibacteria bacterium]|nr:hypothetical protein [Candidatus Peregrinibacteria bacterium]